MVAGAVALLAFAATSSPSAPPQTDPSTGPEPQPQFDSADVVLHNGLSEDAVVRLRRLAVAVDLDCEAIAEAPGSLLSEALLGPTESWTLPAGDNLGLNATDGRGCEVIRIEGDGLAPRWLLWEPAVRTEQEFAPDVEPSGDGVVRLTAEGSGWLISGPETLVFAPEQRARGVELCAPIADGRRVAWGDPVPTGGLLTEAVWGPDGCASVRFSSDDEAPLDPWYVCVPEDAWPFSPGDRVQVESVFGTSSEAVSLRTEDGIRTMQVARASEPPAVEGLSFEYQPEAACGYDVEPRCGTVSRTGALMVSDDEGVVWPLAAGDVVTGLRTSQAVGTTRIEVLVAQELHALDPECALGPDLLGPDLEVVVTYTEDEE